MFKVGLSKSLDLNASLNDGAADANVTYEAAPGSEDVLTVDSSTGVVTPVAVGVGVVLVKDGTGTVLSRVTVSVLSDDEMAVRDEIKAGTKKVAVNAAVLSGVSSSYNLSPAGSTAITTSNFKFGGSSAYFNGSNTGLSIPVDQNLNIGSNDFTIEFWCYPYARTVMYPSIISASQSWSDGGGSFAFRHDSAGASTNKFNLWWNTWNLWALETTNAFPPEAWYHVAIVRSGASLKIFINGVQEATATVTNGYTVNLGDGAGRIGSSPWDGSGGYYKGNVDDLRIYKGVAKYTGNFTPPTSALPLGSDDPNWANCVLAMPMDGENGSASFPIYKA